MHHTSEIRLLVADDHEVAHCGIKGLLVGTGIKIVAKAATRQAAVKYALQHEVDVVLMDVRMPDDDGLIALSRIKLDKPDLPILMLSAFDNPEYVSRAVALGTSGYLLNDCTRDQLLNAIRIHQSNPRRHSLTFIIAPHAKTVRLLCRVPPQLEAALLGQLGAHYPDATIARLPDDALALPPGDCAWSVDLRLRPDIFPLRRYAQFEDPLNRNAADPLTALFAAFAVRSSRGLPRPDRDHDPTGWPTASRPGPRTLRLLAHPFLQSRPTVARAYALAATSSSLPVRHAAFAVTAPSCVRAPLLPLPARLPPQGHMIVRTIGRPRPTSSAVTSSRATSASSHSPLRAPPTVPTRNLPGSPVLSGRSPCPILLVSSLHTSSNTSRMPDRPGMPRLPPLVRGVATLWHPATSTVRTPPWPSPQAASWNRPSCCRHRSTSPELAVLGRTKFRSRRQVFGIRA